MLRERRGEVVFGAVIAILVLGGAIAAYAQHQHRLPPPARAWPLVLGARVAASHDGLSLFDTSDGKHYRYLIVTAHGETSRELLERSVAHVRDLGWSVERAPDQTGPLADVHGYYVTSRDAAVIGSVFSGPQEDLLNAALNAAQTRARHDGDAFVEVDLSRP